MAFFVVCMSEDLSIGCLEEGVGTEPTEWSIVGRHDARLDAATRAKALAADDTLPRCLRRTYLVLEGFEAGLAR